VLALLAGAAWRAGAQVLPRGTSGIAANREEPVNVTGNETVYDSRSDSFTVIGNAKMTQGGSVLTADRIVLYRKQRQAVATGNVHLIDPEVEIWAKSAKVDLVDETLELDNAKVLAKSTSYHIEGDKVRKLQGQNYQVTSGFFTTCGCDNGRPDWAITADTMDLQVGGVGTAHGGSFAVLGYPLFKLPITDFPADTDRQSGFLSGRQGESGLRGFQMIQPYYLAINKSSDATFALDVETSQRIGGMAEYRLTNGVDDYFWADAAYYNESIRSEANREGDIVDDQIADPHIPIDRYDLIAMARQHLTDNLMLFGDTVAVSDSLLLRELDLWTLSRGFGANFGSLRAAPSHFGLLDEYDGGFAQIEGTFYQDLIQPQAAALQRLPEALISGREDLPGGLAYTDYDGEADYFQRDQGVQGFRFAMDPDLTVPWRLGDYLYGFGKAGVQGIVYDTSGHQIAIIPVGTKGHTYNNGLAEGPLTQGGLQANGVPYAEAGVSSILERVFNTNWNSIDKLKNTVEPFADYAYVPRIYQGDQPLFDERDRIEPRSLLTYGVTTRLFAKMNPESNTNEESEQNAANGEVQGPLGQASQPVEALAPVGTPSYSRGNEVRELASFTVMQSVDPTHEIAPSNGKISDLQNLLNIYPTELMSLSSEVDYNPRNNAGITYASAAMNFQPPWTLGQNRNMFMGKALQGSFLQVAYSYVGRDDAVEQSTAKNASQFGTMRAYSDVLDRLGLYFAPSYDFAAGRLLSAEYGVRLKSPCDCWAADLGITQSYNPNEVQVQFQLTLGGLGSIGKSPFGRNPFQTMGLVGNPTGVLPNSLAN